MKEQIQKLNMYSVKMKKAIIALSDEIKVKDNNNILILIDSIFRTDITIHELIDEDRKSNPLTKENLQVNPNIQQQLKK